MLSSHSSAHYAVTTCARHWKEITTFQLQLVFLQNKTVFLCGHSTMTKFRKFNTDAILLLNIQLAFKFHQVVQ